MREQIAQQPLARPASHSIHDAPPSWISQLDAPPKHNARAGIEPDRQQENQAPASGTPAEPPPAKQQSNPPARSLHMKIWDEPADVPDNAEDDEVELLPTKPLASAPNGAAPNNSYAPSSPARTPRDPHADEMEQLDTVPLATPSPALHRQTPWPSAATNGQPPARSQQSNLFAERSSIPASPFPTSAPTMQPLSQPGLSGQPAVQPAAPSRATSGSGKKGRLIALIALAALVVIAAIAFVVVKQPFSVEPVTQPQQTYSSTQFAFSLQYPNGWQISVNGTKGTTTFTDTSHTGQFIVLVTASGSSPSQFLQQEAGKLGMTNEQTNFSPASFAGASWQQIKGSVLVNGATYTETLFSAVHGTSLYTIMQLAPQTTYAQEEQIVFSAMRASFNFT